MPKVETETRRLRLGREWYDATDAARELGVQPAHLTDDIRPLLTHTSRSLTGARSARGVGYAYAREDIRLCREIMNTLGCRALKAAQVMHAARRLHETGLLERITAVADALEELPRYKRRRQ